MENQGRPIPSDERRGALVLAGILVVWGIFWAIASAQIPIRATVLAPGVVPMWVGVILAALSSVFFLACWRTPSRPPADLDRGPLFPERRMIVKLVALLAALLLYIIALPTIHYLVNTFLLMVVALAIFGERLRPRLVIVAVTISVFLFVVFVMLLDVPLPGSRFG